MQIVTKSLTCGISDELAVTDAKPCANAEATTSVEDSSHVAADRAAQSPRMPKAKDPDVPRLESDDVDGGDLQSTDELLHEAGAWSANVDNLAAFHGAVQDADLIDQLHGIELAVGKFSH